MQKVIIDYLWLYSSITTTNHYVDVANHMKNATTIEQLATNSHPSNSSVTVNVVSVNSNSDY